MADSDPTIDEMKPIQPLVGDPSPMDDAAETMLAASRTMLAAAAQFSSAADPASARARELTAEAIETGFLRALRRDTLLGETEVAGAGSLLGLPSGVRVSGTGYGRVGARITGSGARAQLYGAIGGAIGYAVGGPVGAVLGGMLGGLLGGGDDDGDDEQARQEALRRQWLNTPEGFEIQAYLYNLARGYSLVPSFIGTKTPGPWGDLPWPTGFPWFSLPTAPRPGAQFIVNMSPGSVQITGQGEQSGEQAARAFAGALGRVLRLNSVVVPAAGLGGDI
jgi:hypothetical protein